MLLHLVNLALPYNVVGVGAGEASRLQVAPHLRLAVGRPPVEEQLVHLQAHHSTQAHLVAVQWEAPVEETDIFEVRTKTNTCPCCRIKSRQRQLSVLVPSLREEKLSAAPPWGWRSPRAGQTRSQRRNSTFRIHFSPRPHCAPGGRGLWQSVHHRTWTPPKSLSLYTSLGDICKIAINKILAICLGRRDVTGCQIT